MKARITCPHCGFTTAISTDRIPAKARYAACPRCRERIPLRPQEPAAPPPSGAHEGGPAPPAAEEEAPVSRRGPCPWEDRHRVGLWPGIYRSFLGVLLSPAAFFRALHHGEGLREPLALGLLFGSLGVMVGLFWDFVMAVWGIGGGMSALSSRFDAALLFPALLVLSPVFVAVWIFLFSGILHAALWAVRGAGNGFEATFRVVAYGQASQVLAVVPFLGSIVGGIWSLVILVAGLREIHGTSYGRVVAAFLLLTGLALAVLAAVLIPVVLSLLR